MGTGRNQQEKQEQKQDIALVYPVAGLSSRFKGRIKQFAKVGPNGESLIEYSLKQALPAGFTKIIFIIGDKTEDAFKEKFGDSYITSEGEKIPIKYAKQTYDPEKRDKPWGTTDALLSAKEVVDCPFVFCNGDDLYGEETFKILVNHLKNPENKNKEATIGYKLENVLPEEGTTNRGVFSTDSEGNVKDIKEYFDIEKSNLEASGLTLESLASMNIFAFHPEIFDLLQEKLDKFKEEKLSQGDRKAEALLPEHLSELIDEGKIKIKLYTTPDVWYGVTNPEDEETVRKKLAGEE